MQSRLQSQVSSSLEFPSLYFQRRKASSALMLCRVLLLDLVSAELRVGNNNRRTD